MAKCYNGLVMVTARLRRNYNFPHVPDRIFILILKIAFPKFHLTTVSLFVLRTKLVKAIENYSYLQECTFIKLFSTVKMRAVYKRPKEKILRKFTPLRMPNTDLSAVCALPFNF